ncbi:hypothetical protein [Streptomyces sp. URMC 124]|uniref:hypothetical protein n=1 Tax=Streptomyces sp. URMC 124 TaxID=3423405 RepID=UPI003F1A1214
MLESVDAPAGTPGRRAAEAAPPPGRMLPVAAVCVLYVLVQLALTVPGTGLGWDETVYAGQVSRIVPAPYFSAPRARGITYPAAPLVRLTPSVLALRVWMALLSGAGLFLALRVWRRLLPAGVLALAAALFAGLWVSLFYGPQVMPNLWSAYGALLATGAFLRLARDGHDRAAAAWTAAGVAVTALMRPPDAVWLVAALACCAVCVRRWRRPVLWAALAAGLLVGCAPWVAEAYTAYGGLAARLRRAGEIQGGLGWHFALDDHLRALDGRGLCRPCTVPWRHKAAAVWWFALPVVVAGGVRAAVRAGRTASALVPVVAAAALAAPYLFTVGYAAPRFLLPAYALLALPAALCLRWAAAPGGRLRALPAGLVVIGLCGHLAVQARIAAHAADRSRLLRIANGADAARLHRLGVRPPCVLSGDRAVPLAFHTGCASRQTTGPDASVTERELARLAARQPVGILVPPHGQPPAFARTWRAAAMPEGRSGGGHRVYLSPPAVTAAEQ